jgi:hypothetical protein
VEMMRRYKVDGACLQETIKEKFTNRELNGLSGGRQFC